MEHECKLTLQEMLEGLNTLLASREILRRDLSDLTKTIIEMRKRIHEEQMVQLKQISPAQCDAYTRYVFFQGAEYKQHRCPFKGQHQINGKSYCMRHADKIRQGITFEHGTQAELAIAYRKNKHYYPSASSNRTGP